MKTLNIRTHVRACIAAGAAALVMQAILVVGAFWEKEGWLALTRATMSVIALGFLFSLAGAAQRLLRENDRLRADRGDDSTIAR